MENFAIIAAVLIGLSVGYIFGKKSNPTDTTQYENRIFGLEGQVETLKTLNDSLQKKVNEQTAFDASLEPLKEQVLELQRIANKSNETRAEAEENIRSSIKNIGQSYDKLSTETSRLSTALTRSQDRGQWGELQLQQLLEDSGLIEGVHFIAQHHIQDDDGKKYKPDFTIELPGHHHLVIDSKFPFEAYWEAMDEQDQTRKDELLKKHAADVLKHAKDLNKKNYSEHIKGPKYVIMWLPFESMLSAAVQADPSLLKTCMQMKISLTTPTLFYGMTTQLSYIWQQVNLAENAELVRTEATKLLVAIRALAASLQTLGGGLTTAVTHYNAFRSKFVKTAFGKSNALETLGISVAGELKNPVEIQKMPDALETDSGIIDVEPIDEIEQ